MYNGNKINELLKERNIKKKELVSYLNTSRAAVEHMIHGNPTVLSIEKIADFFDVSIELFFIRERDDIGTNYVKKDL